MAPDRDNKTVRVETDDASSTEVPSADVEASPSEPSGTEVAPNDEETLADEPDAPLTSSAAAAHTRRASAQRARMVSPSWTARGVVVRTPDPLSEDSYAARERESAIQEARERQSNENQPRSQEEWVKEEEGFYVPPAPAEDSPYNSRIADRDTLRRDQREQRRKRREAARSARRQRKSEAPSQEPSRRNEADATPLAPHHRRRLVIIACAVIVGIGVAAGGVYAYNHPAQPQVAPEEDTQAEEEETALPDAQATLADYSWPELSRIAEEISAQDDEESALQVAEQFNICDSSGAIIDQTKDVELSDGTVLPMRVAGIYHDDKTDGTGKAGLTFICSNAALRRVMDDSGYEDGWEGTQMRAWLNSTILSEFPEDLQSKVISVNKITNNVGVASDPSVVSATSDRLWLPSLAELCGSFDGWHVSWKTVLAAEGTQYQWFSEQGAHSYGSNTALQMKTADGDSTSWWTRSVSPTGYAYRSIDEDGNPVGYNTLPEELGVVVGFCL